MARLVSRTSSVEKYKKKTGAGVGLAKLVAYAVACENDFTCQYGKNRSMVQAELAKNSPIIQSRDIQTMGMEMDCL